MNEQEIKEIRRETLREVEGLLENYRGDMFKINIHKFFKLYSKKRGEDENKRRIS